MKTQIRLASFFAVALGWLAWAGLAPVARAEEVLNNAAIIELKQMGLGESVIAEKIKSSRCDFDVTIAGLKQLKSNNVPDAVIQAMIVAGAPAPTVPATSTAPPITAPNTTAVTPVAVVTSADPNDPAAPHAAGVWVMQEINGQKKMTQLESEPAVETSSGGFIGPYGIGKVAQTVRLKGARSDLQLADSHPVFYFYLGRARSDGGQSTAYEFSSARSAKDFTLAQFTVTKDGDRALEVGREGGYGGSSGVARKVLRDFASEKIGDGIYKITPKDNLYLGEYSFCRAITRGQGEFYPFGIGAVGVSTNSTANTRESDVARLTASLNSNRPESAIKALTALRDMNAREAVPAIIPLLKNSDGHVICETCRTLAVLGNKDNIPAIEPLVSKPLDFVKTEGPALSANAFFQRKKLLNEIRKEAQDAVTTLQAKP